MIILSNDHTGIFLYYSIFQFYRLILAAELYTLFINHGMPFIVSCVSVCKLFFSFSISVIDGLLYFIFLVLLLIIIHFDVLMCIVFSLEFEFWHFLLLDEQLIESFWGFGKIVSVFYKPRINRIFSRKRVNFS